MCVHPIMLYPIATICHPSSAKGHKYIIVFIDYFSKWAKAMTTFFNDGETIVLFIFNLVIARSNVPTHKSFPN